MGIIVGVGTFQMSIHSPLTHEVTGSFVLITVIGVVIETKDLSNPAIERFRKRSVCPNEEFVVIDCSTSRYTCLIITVDKYIFTITNKDDHGFAL